MRLLIALVAGSAVLVASAVVLGDYPLSGSVPWVAAGVIPLLIGAAMSAVAGGQRPALWIATGPLAGLSFAWGVRIATGWGLDPVPSSCWAALAIAVVWPPAWALGRAALPRGQRGEAAGGPGAPGSVDGDLGDLGRAGRAQVGDP